MLLLLAAGLHLWFSAPRCWEGRCYIGVLLRIGSSLRVKASPKDTARLSSGQGLKGIYKSTIEIQCLYQAGDIHHNQSLAVVLVGGCDFFPDLILVESPQAAWFLLRCKSPCNVVLQQGRECGAARQVPTGPMRGLLQIPPRAT